MFIDPDKEAHSFADVKEGYWAEFTQNLQAEERDRPATPGPEWYQRMVSHRPDPRAEDIMHLDN